MTKTELIEAIAADTGIGRTDASRAVESLTRHVARALRGGEKVTLVGFGTFEPTERAAREGRNPRTGEALRIPASRSVRFRPGNELRSSLNR